MAVVLAKAVFDFAGSQEDDLSLKENDIVKILEKDDSGWWTGCLLSDESKKGDFPFNYVEVLSAAEASYVLAALGGAADATADAFGEAADEVSFVGASVESAKVNNFSRDAASGAVVHELTSVLNDGRTKVTSKTMHDFRRIDAQLRTLVPDFDGRLPPSWGDAAGLSTREMEKRKQALQTYLVRVLDNASVSFLLVPWLFPGEAVDMQPESFAAAARAQEKAKAIGVVSDDTTPTLAKVMFSWEPTDRVELRIDEGDVVEVSAAETGSDGWWSGRTADGERGMFPFNYVETLDAETTEAFLSGRQLVDIRADAAPSNSGSKRRQTHLIGATIDKQKMRFLPDFHLNSIESMDALIEDGYAMEGIDGKGPFHSSANGDTPNVGDQVKLQFTAYVFDADSGTFGEITSSESEGLLVFVVNKDSGIIQALHEVVTYMGQGDCSRIVVAPEKAYGVAGWPPMIPPSAHMLYDLKMLEFGSETAEATEAARASATVSQTPSPPSVVPRSPQASPNRVASLRAAAPVTNKKSRESHREYEEQPVPPVVALDDAAEAEVFAKSPPRAGGGSIVKKVSDAASSALNSMRPKSLTKNKAAAKSMAAAVANAPTIVTVRRQQEKRRMAGHVMLAPSGSVVVVEREFSAQPASMTEAQVQERRKEEGFMDPARLEDYLTEPEFSRVFGTSRKEFILKPSWKQKNAKLGVNLW